MKTRHLLLILICALSARISFSQTYYPLGNNPNSGVAPTGSGHIGSDVNTICGDTLTGYLYVGGNFTTAGNTSLAAHGIAKWDGTTWSTVGTGVGPNSGYSINDMIMFNGELIVAGEFTSLDGVPALRVAKWNGSSWTQMGNGFDASVYALEIHNGELYAGGYFYQTGSVICKKLAKWNGSTWVQVGPGIDNQPVNPYNNSLVYSLQSYGGYLFIGSTYGAPFYIGSTFLGSMAKWDGISYTQAGTTQSTNEINGFAVHNGQLYTTEHIYVGSQTKPWVWNGTDWVAASINGFSAGIESIVSFQGKLYIGTNSNAMPCMYYLNGNTFTTTSGTAGAIGVGGTGGYDEITCFHVFNNYLYLGGNFVNAGNTNNVNNIAKYTGPAKPGAAFSISNNNFCAGGCANFTDNSTNYPSAWQWSFPGATVTSSTSQNPTNICYAAAGTYTATLVASNSLGSDTLRQVINVVSAPAQPVVVYGNNIVCAGTTQTYSVAPVAGATVYSWTTPGTWTGTSTTNSITYTVGASGGTIFVTANNNCGTSPAKALTISIGTTPPNQPGSISGSTTFCAGSVQTYSVAPVSGASTYTWLLPGGWSGTSSTNTISTTAGSGGGTISVAANNGCGSSSSQTLAVSGSSAPSTPGVISGLASICELSTNTYSVSPVAGATSYTWVCPGGFSGSSTTNTISVTAGINSGNITVSASNACGTSATQTLAVTVNNIPLTPAAIGGLTSICEFSTNTYSVSPVAGATGYTWTYPGGFSGTSTTNTISATAGVNSGNITVSAANACGTSAAQTLAVTVNNAPAQPGAISGVTTLCAGSANTYSVINSGASSYVWSFPGGWSGSSATNIVSATAGSSGTITVTASNSCGSSTPQTLSVTVNALPTVSLTATSNTLCVNNNAVSLTGSPSGGTISGTGVAGNTFDPAVSGVGTFTLSYSYIDVNNCSNTATTVMVVNACTDIKQAGAGQITIYPNPFGASILLGNIETAATATLYNAIGEVVASKQLTKRGSEINTEALAAGVYYIQVKSNTGLVTKKMIKQ